MMIYITKYALTDGIKPLEISENEITSTGGVYTRTYKHFSKGDFELTKEAAIEKAEKMRQRKIASMEKSLTKLKTMEFKIRIK